MILIDGYNLLHVTEVFGQGTQAGTLEGARSALLDALAARLTDRERRSASIVFDAAGAPPGLPDEYRHEGIRVLFARGYPDADGMLEAIIEQARAPKELVVVSGDHRVQRAARGRGAAWLDSSLWWTELSQRNDSDSSDPDDKRYGGHDVGDTEYWVSRFTSPESPESAEGTSFHASAEEPRPPGEESGAPEPQEFFFPPGYADDLAKRLERPHD